MNTVYGIDVFCGSQENKQHLNLSQHAQEIIDSDLSAFHCKNKTAFINHVFNAFRKDLTYPVHRPCKAVLSRTLEEEHQALLKKIEKAREEKKLPLPDEEAVRQVLEVLKDQREKELIAQYTSLPLGDGFKFRLNNENYNYLSDIVLCPERKIYDRSGQYIKAVMEEYAELPFIEREAVYFTEKLEMIQRHIETGRELVVMAKGGAYYRVRPYRIVKAVYHYLIGLCYPYDGTASMATPQTFRVSNATLKDSTRKSFISQKEAAELDEQIRKKGAAFIGSQADTIQIRLSDRGMKLYRQLLHLRPDPTIPPEEDGHLLTFTCAPKQIEVYFQRFGQHAQVVSPVSLAEKFKWFYQKGYEAQARALEACSASEADGTE